MEASETTPDRLYTLVANEEDARVCTDIDDDACRVVPGNFFLILCSLVLTNIGDLLVSPKIVLSVIGVLLLATGGVSAVASLVSVEAVLILLGSMGAAGTLSARRLRDV